jgi:hypothetical protein
MWQTGMPDSREATARAASESKIAHVTADDLGCRNTSESLPCANHQRLIVLIQAELRFFLSLGTNRLEPASN